MYATHMREQGYTDADGNFVKGTMVIAEENRQNFITEVTDMGYEFSETGDSYMTFKKDAQISSVIKVKADFSDEGVKVLDYICDIYFEDSSSIENIQSVISKVVPGLNLGAEFSIATALEEYNASHTTVTRESPSSSLELKPIEGFGGVVVGLKMKQK